MRFSDIPGHETEKRVLMSMADSGRVPHAMMLYENEGCGAFPLALAFLQYLTCASGSSGDSCGECPSCNRISKMIHPDVQIIFPTNTGRFSGSLDAKNVVSEVYSSQFRELALANPYFMESDLSEAIGVEAKSCDINVEEVRRLVSKLSLTSCEGGYKAVIFMQPEKINIQAANKLLKTVEEPPEKTVFIFITHHPDKVLQTIASRCQAMRINPMSKEDVAAALVAAGHNEADAQAQAAVCGGSVGQALRELGNGEARQAYRKLFREMADALCARNLLSLLECSDTIVDLGSKEKQKAFLTYMSECFRKVFVIQQGLSQLSFCNVEDLSYHNNLASRLPRNFCRRAQDLMDKTVLQIDRNVNQKILFCDFADRLFLII